MARTTVSKGSSKPQYTYRGYSASKQPTGGYVPSTRTSSGGNSGSSAAAIAAARAAEEEAKRKKREEYKVLINVVKQVGEKVLDANKDLNSAKRALTLYATGALCDSISNAIEKAQEGIEKIVNGINTITGKAKDKIQEYGEIIQNENLKPDYEAIRNAGASVGFSCDTVRIREEVLNPLRNANTKLKEASATGSGAKSLEGCEDVKNVPSEIDDEKSVIDNIVGEVEKYITYAEEMEKQNIGLVDLLGTGLKTMGSWFSGLFNKEEKKEEKKEPSAMEMLTTLKQNSPVQDSFLTKEQDKHATEILAKKYGVDTEDKTTAQVANEVGIELLAREYGVDTQGKVKEEIIDEIVRKAEIDTTTTITTERGNNKEIPLYDQRYNKEYSAMCNPTSFAMIASWATGKTLTPDEIVKMFPEFVNAYKQGEGTGDGPIQKKEILEQVNLKLEGNYYYGEAWGEGKLMEALNNNCVAIFRTTNGEFTDEGHYIVVYSDGDGKIHVNDPYGGNYENPRTSTSKEGYQNGYDPEVFKKFGGNFYVYSLIDPTTTTTTKKTEAEILDEAKSKISGTETGGLIEKLDEIAGNNKVHFGTSPRTVITTNNSIKSDSSAYWSAQKDKEQVEENTNSNNGIFDENITYESGYEKASDVMPYTYLKPSSANDGTKKPLIVWLHGGGKKGLKTYSESNYNLAHIIEASELTNVDAYVLSPVLTSHDDSGAWWCNEKVAQNVTDLIDKFAAENNIDKNNIIIMGGSEGGRGVQYMAETKPEYFSQAVVLSGYAVYGVDNSDSEVPMKGYVGGWDDPKSKGYMEKTLADDIGEENVTTIEGATHNKLPNILYNIDNDGDGESDFIKELFEGLIVEPDSKTTEPTNSTNTNISSRTTIASSTPTKVEISSDPAIVEGLGTEAAREELLGIKQNNNSIQEEKNDTSTVTEDKKTWNLGEILKNILNYNTYGTIGDNSGLIIKNVEISDKNLENRDKTKPTTSSRTVITNNASIKSDSSAYWSTQKGKEEKVNASATTNLQPKNNSDIAHRGYTPGNIYDNTAEGFRLAGDKGFWGCEADIRFDSNGNLVCSHNTVKKGQNPTTFEKYLDICKEYGMTAIIDLKYEKGVGPADPNLSPAVLKIIEEKGMLDSCVLQTNNPTDIPYIRETSEDARIWYLTDEITDKNIELIEKNNIECVNILSSGEKNAYRIKKLLDNEIDVCVWNVQTEKSKEILLNMGAKYVMSDNVLGITPYEEGEEDFNDVKNINSNNTSNIVKEENEIQNNNVVNEIGTKAPTTQSSRTTTRTITNSSKVENITMESGTTITEPNLNEDIIKNNSIFVNTELNDMIMDKHVVELLANKYGVNVGGKTAETVLNEIATKYPDLQDDLDGIKKLIDGNIKFEVETRPSENTKVEINDDSAIIEGLGTEAAREELVDNKKENANLNADSNNTNTVHSNTEKSETTQTEKTEENKPTSDKNTNKPSNSKPSTGNTYTNTETNVAPTVPENTGKPIVDCTPEAIIQSAKNADANSHGEYISEILHEAGYLTEKEMNAYKEYSVKELCEKFENFGWEKIKETEKLQVGDIIIINNDGIESAQIYAGDNRWYNMNQTTAQTMKQNWTENIKWYAYRPTKR